MRLAFLGGTHFIGARAVEHALARGHEVRVLHRGIHPNRHAGARSIAVDRADVDALRRALGAAPTDAIIDTRAMTAADARGSIAACADVGPVVVLSSQDVYAQFGRLLGHPAPSPEDRIDERSPLTVAYPYRDNLAHADREYDKKDVEAAFRDAVEEARISAATVLRLPATYGPGDPQRRFGAFVDRLDVDGTMPRVGGATFRWTHGHVSDVSLAIVLAAEEPPRGFRVFNVGEPEAPTMGEWVERLAASLGVAVRWLQVDEVPEELRHLGAMENDVVVDTRRIRAELGYREITSVPERAADIVAHARASRA